MPGRDGTGPMRQGPMTGCGFGCCGRAARGSYGRRGKGFAGRYGRQFVFAGWDDPQAQTTETGRIEEKIQALMERIESLAGRLANMLGKEDGKDA